MLLEWYETRRSIFSLEFWSVTNDFAFDWGSNVTLSFLEKCNATL